jgi:hypothetical protein
VDGVGVNGSASGQASAASVPSPHLSGTLGFAATAQAPPTGWQYPIYTVWCYQDLNGAGIHQWPIDWANSSMPKLEYAEMRKPSQNLTLGGVVSSWLSSGGDAECWAVLYACGWQGGVEKPPRELDSYGFHAAGRTSEESLLPRRRD